MLSLGCCLDGLSSNLPPLRPSRIQVKRLLASARDMDLLLETVPELLSPKQLLSVLTTVSCYFSNQNRNFTPSLKVNKWYNKWSAKRDPIEVLETDPDLIRRAQDMDVPFEPVRCAVYFECNFILQCEGSSLLIMCLRKGLRGRGWQSRGNRLGPCQLQREESGLAGIYRPHRLSPSPRAVASRSSYWHAVPQAWPH